MPDCQVHLAPAKKKSPRAVNSLAWHVCSSCRDETVNRGMTL